MTSPRDDHPNDGCGVLNREIAWPDQSGGAEEIMAGPESSTPVDPEIIEMVDHVRNRYGAHGLRQLIDLATREAEVTESALAELADAT